MEGSGLSAILGMGKLMLINNMDANWSSETLKWNIMDNLAYLNRRAAREDCKVSRGCVVSYLSPTGAHTFRLYGDEFKSSSKIFPIPTVCKGLDVTQLFEILGQDPQRWKIDDESSARLREANWGPSDEF
jgi:hypothetical protein